MSSVVGRFFERYFDKMKSDLGRIVLYLVRGTILIVLIAVGSESIVSGAMKLI